MFSRQSLRVFTLLTLVLALAHANLSNPNLARREAAKNDLLDGLDSAVGGLAGGLLGAAASSTDSGSSSSATDKSTSTPPPSSSTTTPPPTSSSSVPPKSTSTTPPPTESSTTDGPSKSPSPTQSDNQSQSTTTTTQVVPGQQTSDGSSASKTSSSSKTSNTAAVGQNSGSPTTMSTKTKTTVIGVVVGVGGTIVLAGLFVVAWRIWGRKKSEDEGDGLMGFRSGAAGHEKSGSASGNGPSNPFQSTLENYHNPAKNVNASSNF